MGTSYTYLVELQSADGRLLHQQAVEPDWEPAIEAARLAGLRAHGVWYRTGGVAPSIAPIWATASDVAVVRAFAVALEAEGHSWAVEVPAVPYLEDRVRSIVKAKVQDGALAAGDRVLYQISAVEQAVVRPCPGTGRFEIADANPPCPAVDRALGAAAADTMECGPTDPADIDVVVPEDVLDEMCELTLAAGERETGGVLLGQLCRNPGSGDVGLDVTAQIAARHAEGTGTALTFTADTWTDVRNAVALRKAGELIVGYWHSHPAFLWCKDCPPDRQRACQLASGFLSPDDKALHRVMFPAAYTQAVVMTRSINGLEASWFGWRHGLLERRGFRLRPGAVPRTRARAAARAALPSNTTPACADGRNGPGPSLTKNGDLHAQTTTP